MRRLRLNWKKSNETVAYFKTYAGQYGFDYLMIVAQGYQESMLEHRRGARVGRWELCR